MAKIMLVEDDKNLSAIYKDRLLAEGYDIVAAHDGEEALAMAVKEKPILIIADVMMPKISGFDMLDILRSTPETKNTKVIMMTALSQAEDQQRAAQLGADKYLVKSQVTLDDVARVVKEVLGSESTHTAQSNAPTPATNPAPVAPSESTSAPMPEAPGTTAEPIADEKKEVEKEIENFGANLPTQAPAQPVQSDAQVSGEAINPASTQEPKPDIMALYDKEMAKEASDKPETEAPSNDQQPFDPNNISL